MRRWVLETRSVVPSLISCVQPEVCMASVQLSSSENWVTAMFPSTDLKCFPAHSQIVLYYKSLESFSVDLYENIIQASPFSFCFHCMYLKEHLSMYSLQTDEVRFSQKGERIILAGVIHQCWAYCSYISLSCEINEKRLTQKKLIISKESSVSLISVRDDSITQ